MMFVCREVRALLCAYGFASVVVFAACGSGGGGSSGTGGVGASGGAGGSAGDAAAGTGGSAAGCGENAEPCCPNQKCETPLVCQGAQATCGCPPETPDLCGNVCADLARTVEHCGACGTKCPGVCSNSKCVAVVAMDSGTDHSCAILDDKTLRCWGSGGHGELGTGINIGRSLPVEVPGLTDVAEVAAGSNFTCALLGDGSVSCWGANTHGQLGDGTTTERSVPKPVPGLSGVKHLRADTHGACALIGDGSVLCWGYFKQTPTQEVGPSNFVDLAVGYRHRCALLSDKTVQCWGENGSGQLGDGSKLSSPTPKTVPGLSNVESIRCSSDASCALSSDKSVKCWGNIAPGDGTAITAVSPQTVPGIVDATALALGHQHACVVKTGGSVSCWGTNQFGECGNGDESGYPVYTPFEIVGLTGAVAIEAGKHFSCSPMADGSIQCWGADNLFQVGSSGDTRVPHAVYF